MTAGTDQRQKVQSAAFRVPRPRKMLWWSLGLLAAFVVMGVFVMIGRGVPFTQPLDDWWRTIVGASPDSALYRTAVPMFFQNLGEGPGTLVSVVVIPAVLVIVGRWRSALFFLSITLVGPGLFSQVMKNLVNRPRPAADPEHGLFGPLFLVDHGSFPSGHSVSAGALVFGIAALIPASRRLLRTAWWVIAAVLMVGMVWQRTLVNAHWLSDTVFGLAAGVAAALLMWWVFWPLLRQDYGRPVWFLHLGHRARLTAV
ncbi:phosphatase PAP2 family protein [Leifsonia poae]|uniref:phosphatase PAP2 family protein n=1 Tax=Leifsonia poae TaxID=110933 RepID=UPI001CC14D29|nr:phosphatase PAP2 family protein [Leifsonia poae]